MVRLKAYESNDSWPQHEVKPVTWGFWQYSKLSQWVLGLNWLCLARILKLTRGFSFSWKMREYMGIPKPIAKDILVIYIYIILYIILYICEFFWSSNVTRYSEYISDRRIHRTIPFLLVDQTAKLRWQLQCRESPLEKTVGVACCTRPWWCSRCTDNFVDEWWNVPPNIHMLDLFVAFICFYQPLIPVGSTMFFPRTCCKIQHI